MKPCPICTQSLQDDAHHCQYCNSTIMDGDGNLIVPRFPTVARPSKAALLLQISVMLFFALNFFIDTIIFLQICFGLSVVKANSVFDIIITGLILTLSVAAAFLITPIIINWVKCRFLE
jgi:hypothetical protein